MKGCSYLFDFLTFFVYCKVSTYFRYLLVLWRDLTNLGVLKLNLLWVLLSANLRTIFEPLNLPSEVEVSTFWKELQGKGCCGGEEAGFYLSST